MVDPVSLLGAAAAVLAAGLAGTNLVLSGRRERTKWAREALVDVLVSFLDRSFQMGRTSNAYYLASLDDAPEEKCRPVGEQFLLQDGEQRSALTRIRLLGNSRVVRAAEDLLDADRRYFGAASAADGSEMRDQRAACRLAREAFIVAAKQAIALPRSSVPPISGTSVFTDAQQAPPDRSPPSPR